MPTYSTSQVIRGITSFTGHRIREVALHRERFIQSSDLPRVAIFPSEGRSSGASNLRAYEVGSALRKLGWRVTTVPFQLELSQRLRVVQLEKPDLILLQQSRHELNRPHFYPREIPIVFDIDDADYFDERAKPGVIECCKAAAAVLVGSKAVGDFCRRYNSNVSTVWTSTPIRKRPSPLPITRRRIVAWAHSDPFGYPAEAAFVRDVIGQLAKRTEFEFYLYGVRSPIAALGYFQSVRASGIEVKTFPYMSYESLLSGLAEVAVGLQPVCMDNAFSSGKSFGKILAYLSSDVAVVASDAVDHGEFFTHGRNGMLPRSTLEWVDSIIALLDDPALRQRVTDAANEDLRARLSTPTAAREVDLVLRKVLSGAAIRRTASLGS